MIVDHPVTEKHSVFWYAAVPLMGGHGQVLTPMVVAMVTFDAVDIAFPAFPGVYLFKL